MVTISPGAARHLLFCWILLSSVGCRTEPSQVDESSVRDSSGIQIVSNPGADAGGRFVQWTASEEVSIGEVDGSEDYTFHRIREVSLGPTGRVFVLDGGDQVIKVYDQAGLFSHSVGREGEGPGEFLAASSVFWLGDTLSVFDYRLSRFSHFSVGGDLLGSTVSSLNISEFGLPADWHPIPRGFAVGFGGGCRLPAPEDRRPYWKVLTTDREGSVKDTLTIGVAENVLAIYGDNFCTAALHLGSPGHQLAILPSGVSAYGDGGEYEISLYRLAHESVRVPPAPFRIIRRDLQPVPVSSTEISEYKAGFEVSPDGSRVPREMMEAYEAAWDTLGFRAQHPHFDELLWDNQGRLWVGRAPSTERQEKVWDVFNGEGLLVGEATLPGGLRVEAVWGEMVWGMMEDDLGLTYVKGFRLFEADEGQEPA